LSITDYRVGGLVNGDRSIETFHLAPVLAAQHIITAAGSRKGTLVLLKSALAILAIPRWKLRRGQGLLLGRDRVRKVSGTRVSSRENAEQRRT
jgi:hypothetical protein